MVKAKWEGQYVQTAAGMKWDDHLVVTELTEEETIALPQWVYDSVASVGIAIHNGVAYSSDEKTARENLEF